MASLCAASSISAAAGIAVILCFFYTFFIQCDVFKIQLQINILGTASGGDVIHDRNKYLERNIAVFFCLRDHSKRNFFRIIGAILFFGDIYRFRASDRSAVSICLITDLIIFQPSEITFLTIDRQTVKVQCQRIFFLFYRQFHGMIQSFVCHG